MNDSKQLSARMTTGQTLMGSFYMLCYLFVLGPVVVLLWECLGFPHDTPRAEAWMNLAFFAVNMACCMAIFWDFFADNCRIFFSKLVGVIESIILSGCIYAISCMLINAFTGWVSPNFHNANDARLVAMLQDNPLAMILGIVIMTPFTEELLFRGLIFQNLLEKNRALAYILSIVAFGALHVLGFLGVYEKWEFFWAALGYLPAGLALCWAYEKSDSILTPMLLHCGINLIAVLHFLK